MSSLPSAEWLDVPHITLRFLLRHLMLHPEKKSDYFTNWANELDTRHMNAKGVRIFRFTFPLLPLYSMSSWESKYFCMGEPELTASAF